MSSCTCFSGLWGNRSGKRETGQGFILGWQGLCGSFLFLSLDLLAAFPHAETLNSDPKEDLGFLVILMRLLVSLSSREVKTDWTSQSLSNPVATMEEEGWKGHGGVDTFGVTVGTRCFDGLWLKVEEEMKSKAGRPRSQGNWTCRGQG